MCFDLTTETTVRIETVITQLSCGISVCLSLVTSGATSWPKGFCWPWPSVRVTSERSLAALSVRSIGTPRVGLPLGLGATNLTVFCGGSSPNEWPLDRSGADVNERGSDDSDWGSRGRGAGKSDSSTRVPGCGTELTGSLSSVFFLFGAFLEYFLLCVPAAVSSYRWE